MMKLNKTQKIALFAGVSVATVALAAVAWWLYITFKGRKKTTTTMNTSSANGTNSGSSSGSNTGSGTGSSGVIVTPTPVQSGKTAAGLVEYAIKQIGRPYWFGTYGQRATEELYLNRKKAYPGYYTATDFPSQFGAKVHDCIGLVKGYFWSNGPDDMNPTYAKGFPDIDANVLLSRATEKGLVAAGVPEIPGITLHMPNHVGVYIGNGWVVEAKGHADGVKKTPLKGRGWLSWAKVPGLQY